MRFVSEYKIQNKIRACAPPGLEIVAGMMNGDLQRNWGKDYLYIDHSYFKRGWKHKHFRLIRSYPHLTRVIPQTKDRLQKFDVILKPYRNNGSHIVVYAPGRTISTVYQNEGIENKMAEELKKYTDRPISIMIKGHNFTEALVDAWAVVCPVSVAGVEAAVAGYPVFSTHMCPTWPINSGSLSKIENPVLHERYDWANSLAWASWHIDEIKHINYAEYQCE